MVALIFVSAFGPLALSFWPYLIPFVITIDEAAAPQSSLMFMFWGGVVVFPLMLVYTLVSYFLFREKTKTKTVHYEPSREDEECPTKKKPKKPHEENEP